MKSNSHALVGRGQSSVYGTGVDGTVRSNHPSSAIPYSSTRDRPIQNPISCNKCRKPLRTILFVCTCDCVFCEECTYAHFNDSSRCPSCGKSLGADDFTELVVADPSAASNETLKNTLQTMFTKLTSGSDFLSQLDISTRLLKDLDNSCRCARFLLKQLVFDCSSRVQSSSSMAQELEFARQENTTLKQENSTLRINLEQTVADFKHREQGLNGTVQEMQKKLDEKEIQITQFRQLIAKQMARVPGTGARPQIDAGEKQRAHREAYDFGGGMGYHSRHEHESMNVRPVVSSTSTHHSTTPPLQGIVLQQKANEEAKAKAMGDLTRSRIGSIIAAQQRPESRLTSSMAHHSQLHSRSARHQDVDSVITPIQIPNNTSSYTRIAGNRSSPLNAERGRSPIVAGSQPCTPRIRDLTASSGYVFTSRSYHPTNTSNHGDLAHGVKRSLSPAENRQYQAKTMFGFSRNGARH